MSNSAVGSLPGIPSSTEAWFQHVCYLSHYGCLNTPPPPPAPFPMFPIVSTSSANHAYTAQQSSYSTLFDAPLGRYGRPKGLCYVACTPSTGNAAAAECNAHVWNSEFQTESI